MSKNMKFTLARYAILGFCFGGIMKYRPEAGTEYITLDYAVFYAYVFLFVYLVIKWCITR